MKLITLFIALLLFSGCSKKFETQIVKEKEIICTKQELYPYNKQIKVRVHPQDLAVHQARADYLKKGFEFYENQVKRNNKCLKVNQIQ